MSESHLVLWGIFGIVFIAMLALDLGVHKSQKKHMTYGDSLLWSVIWIGSALVFGGIVYFFQGKEAGLEYITAYIIEKSLSLDNIFVFVMIFESFKIPLKYQRRVLLWGIIGALAMRAIIIAFGISLITKFHFVIYIFGGFLVYTGLHFFLTKESHEDPKKGWLYTKLKKILPVTEKLHGEKFWITEPHKGNQRVWIATPLFVVLVLVEFTDLIFAVDSIPAVLAVSKDPMIIYTSNIFAILGLRALYFLLANAIKSMHYLKVGLACILCFVGVKMMIVDFYKIPIFVSLIVILSTLTVTVTASIIREKLLKGNKV